MVKMITIFSFVTESMKISRKIVIKFYYKMTTICVMFIHIILYMNFFLLKIVSNLMRYYCLLDAQILFTLSHVFLRVSIQLCSCFLAVTVMLVCRRRITAATPNGQYSSAGVQSCRQSLPAIATALKKYAVCILKLEL